MSNPLEKALANARQKRGWDKPTAEAEEQESGNSYSITCKGCGSSFQFSDEDLPNFRTDPSTGSTDDDDTEQDDTDEDEELDDKAKSALVQKILSRKTKL